MNVSDESILTDEQESLKIQIKSEKSHFHYALVAINDLKLEIIGTNFKNQLKITSKSKEIVDPNSPTPSFVIPNFNSVSPFISTTTTPAPATPTTAITNGWCSNWFYLLVSSGDHGWTLLRNFDSLVDIDKHLHKCVFNRTNTCLPCLDNIVITENNKKAVFLKVKTYIDVLNLVLSDKANLITCVPILDWMEIDSKGRRLMIMKTESSVNIPALCAVQAIKSYVATEGDELSFEVGDLISVINKTKPTESDWWRGKKDCRVGYFPSEYVEVVQGATKQATNQAIFKVTELNKPVLKKKGKFTAMLLSFLSSRPNRLELRRGGIVKERLFGCDLGEHLSNSAEKVPVIMLRCIEFIEKEVLVDGLYRLSGLSSNLQKLRYDFDTDNSSHIDFPLNGNNDFHTVPSLLKMYFRELPNPLLTNQLSRRFIEASKISDTTSRIDALRRVITFLPPPHYRTAKVLFEHLHRVAQISDVTNMNAHNLSIVWAPNLLTSNMGVVDCDNMLKVAIAHALLVEEVISNVNILFNDSGENRPLRPKSFNPSSITSNLISLEEAQKIFGGDKQNVEETNAVAREAVASGVDVIAGRSSLSTFYDIQQIHSVINLPKKATKKKEFSKLSKDFKSYQDLSVANLKPDRKIVRSFDGDDSDVMEEEEGMSTKKIRATRMKHCDSDPSMIEGTFDGGGARRRDGKKIGTSRGSEGSGGDLSRSVEIGFGRCFLSKGGGSNLVLLSNHGAKNIATMTAHTDNVVTKVANVGANHIANATDLEPKENNTAKTLKSSSSIFKLPNLKIFHNKTSQSYDLFNSPTINTLSHVLTSSTTTVDPAFKTNNAVTSNTTFFPKPNSRIVGQTITSPIQASPTPPIRTNSTKNPLSSLPQSMHQMEDVLRQQQPNQLVSDDVLKKTRQSLNRWKHDKVNENCKINDPHMDDEGDSSLHPFSFQPDRLPSSAPVHPYLQHTTNINDRRHMSILAGDGEDGDDYDDCSFMDNSEMFNSLNCESETYREIMDDKKSNENHQGHNNKTSKNAPNHKHNNNFSFNRLMSISKSTKDLKSVPHKNEVGGERESPLEGRGGRMGWGKDAIMSELVKWREGVEKIEENNFIDTDKKMYKYGLQGDFEGLVGETFGSGNAVGSNIIADRENDVGRKNKFEFSECTKGNKSGVSSIKSFKGFANNMNMRVPLNKILHHNDSLENNSSSKHNSTNKKLLNNLQTDLVNVKMNDSIRDKMANNKDDISDTDLVNDKYNSCNKSNKYNIINIPNSASTVGTIVDSSAYNNIKNKGKNNNYNNITSKSPSCSHNNNSIFFESSYNILKKNEKEDFIESKGRNQSTLQSSINLSRKPTCSNQTMHSFDLSMYKAIKTDQFNNQSTNKSTCNMFTPASQSLNSSSFKQPSKSHMNQPINKLFNQSVKISINQPVNQSINHPVNQPVNQSINQPIYQSTKYVTVIDINSSDQPTNDQLKSSTVILL